MVLKGRLFIMEKQELTIRAWKDAEFRAKLNPEQLAMIAPNPVGEALLEEELSQHMGGNSRGWWNSMSGECQPILSCCNPFGSGW